MAIVVAGIGATAFVSFYLGVADGRAKAEARTVASFLAQGLMDEVRSKRFDESHMPPFSRNLRTENPENSSDKATFDDVDDFDGWSERPSGFDAHVLSVSVVYVREDNLDGQSGSRTGFKRITVQATLGEEIVAEVKSVVSGW